MSPSETLCSLRAIIVDDEPLARKHIARMLGRHADIVVIETCGDGRNALELIRDKRPDLLFLDVEMPEFDGFDILESLGSDLPKATVFCDCLRSIRGESLRSRGLGLSSQTFRRCKIRSNAR